VSGRPSDILRVLLALAIVIAVTMNLVFLALILC